MSNNRTDTTNTTDTGEKVTYKVSLPGRLFFVTFLVDKSHDEGPIREYLNEVGIYGGLIPLCQGDYWEIICRQISYHIYYSAQTFNQAIDYFENDPKRAAHIKLDGSQGIELIEIDFPCIEAEDFVVEKGNDDEDFYDLDGSDIIDDWGWEV